MSIKEQGRSQEWPVLSKVVSMRGRFQGQHLSKEEAESRHGSCPSSLLCWRSRHRLCSRQSSASTSGAGPAFLLGAAGGFTAQGLQFQNLSQQPKGQQRLCLTLPDLLQPPIHLTRPLWLLSGMAVRFCATCPRDARMDPDARGLIISVEAHPCPCRPLHMSKLPYPLSWGGTIPAGMYPRRPSAKRTPPAIPGDEAHPREPLLPGCPPDGTS